MCRKDYDKYSRFNVDRSLEGVGVHWWGAVAQERLTGITEAEMWWLDVTRSLGSCVSELNGDTSAVVPESADTRNEIAQVLEKVSAMKVQTSLLRRIVAAGCRYDPERRYLDGTLQMMEDSIHDTSGSANLMRCSL